MVRTYNIIEKELNHSHIAGENKLYHMNHDTIYNCYIKLLLAHIQDLCHHYKYN